MQITTAADEIKRRMLKVASHYLDEHPSYGPELIAIRAGTGYQDTANDLQQLADLYDAADVKPVVSKDPTHYRTTDVADARKYAAQIFKALGYDSAEAAEWNNNVQRAYTYLDDVYTEHCRAGGLLFFRSEDVDVTYPMSLVSVVRAPRGRTEAAPVEGAPPAAPAAPAAI